MDNPAADLVADFYLRLVEKGIPEDNALELSKSFLTTALKGAFEKQGQSTNAIEAWLQNQKVKGV